MNKVTFIHLSKNIAGNPDTLLLPMGLPALANFLKQNKINSEIIHNELEIARNSNFDLIRYLKANNRHIFCFDLYWYNQSSKVIKTIKKIKQNIPDSYTIIGGFTASFFAKEILSDFPEVDFVIRGDAEMPLLRLINLLQLGDKNYKSIPNLAWRSNKRIILNRQSYIVSQAIIDNLEFTNFKLLKNHNRYNRIHLNSSVKKQSQCLSCNKRCDKIFYYNCGRGCPVNCSFCGGSNTAQKIINARPKPILINQLSVIKELKNAAKSGFKEWRTSFDPYPRNDYYIKLFRKIRKEKLNFIMDFDCWSLPTKEFVDEFVKAFDKNKSKIVISPECGSELIRKKNKGYFYSNNDLISTIRYINSKGIKMVLYFVVGLPFEKKEDMVKTLILINFIRNNFKNIKIRCRPIEFEPASLCFLQRKKYGISSNIESFRDYYRSHNKKCDVSVYNTNYFSKKEISEITKLLQAEANCAKSKSYFLKNLLGPSFNLEKSDFAELYNRFCQKCEQFNKCNRISDDYKCVKENIFYV